MHTHTYIYTHTYTHVLKCRVDKFVHCVGYTVSNLLTLPNPFLPVILRKTELPKEHLSN